VRTGPRGDPAHDFRGAVAVYSRDAGEAGREFVGYGIGERGKVGIQRVAPAREGASYFVWGTVRVGEGRGFPDGFDQPVDDDVGGCDVGYGPVEWKLRKGRRMKVDKSAHQASAKKLADSGV
jgi:hypothetical protein